MWLDTWMIVTLITFFGLCAILNRRGGFIKGAMVTLSVLEERNLIKVTEDGDVRRWTAYDDVPVVPKKRKSRQVNKTL
jgi:hypothetical protein